MNYKVGGTNQDATERSRSRALAEADAMIEAAEHHVEHKQLELNEAQARLDCERARRQLLIRDSAVTREALQLALAQLERAQSLV